METLRSERELAQVVLSETTSFNLKRPESAPAARGKKYRSAKNGEVINRLAKPIVRSAVPGPPLDAGGDIPITKPKRSMSAKAQRESAARLSGAAPAKPSAWEELGPGRAAAGSGQRPHTAPSGRSAGTPSPPRGASPGPRPASSPARSRSPSPFERFLHAPAPRPVSPAEQQEKMRTLSSPTRQRDKVKAALLRWPASTHSATPPFFFFFFFFLCSFICIYLYTTYRWSPMAFPKALSIGFHITQPKYRAQVRTVQCPRNRCPEVSV